MEEVLLGLQKLLASEEQASDLPGHCLDLCAQELTTATSESRCAFDKRESEAWNFLNPLESWPAPRVWKIS